MKIDLISCFLGTQWSLIHSVSVLTLLMPIVSSGVSLSRWRGREGRGCCQQPISKELSLWPPNLLSLQGWHSWDHKGQLSQRYPGSWTRPVLVSSDAGGPGSTALWTGPGGRVLLGTRQPGIGSQTFHPRLPRAPGHGRGLLTDLWPRAPLGHKKTRSSFSTWEMDGWALLVIFPTFHREFE